MRRLALLWLLLFGAYATTLGVPARGTERFAGAEAHHLLTAASITADGDVDVADQYADRAYGGWYAGVLRPAGRATGGRLNEPSGAGFPLLIAPAFALGGPLAVELLLAALAALAFTLAVPLARRLVPDPWATAAPVTVGLSPPALAYASTVSPELTAGAVLAGALLLALGARERPRLRCALPAGLLLALLPWLGPRFALPGAVVLVLLVRWLLRRNRRLAALVAGEVVLTSAVAYITVNDRLYGGFTPYSASAGGSDPIGADVPLGVVRRTDRLLGLWVDRDAGVLRWAPFLVLALYAVWLLWRSRRDGLARVIPERRDVEVAAGAMVAVCAVQVLLAAFFAPTMFGPGFPGRQLVPALPVAAALAAWGLRHAPRVGAALAVLTLAGSGWLLALLWTGEGSWSAPPAAPPLGPLRELLPQAGTGTAASWVALAVVAAALGALAVGETRRRRRVVGMERPDVVP